jgi:membrane associated rhomboid family serine protease
MSAEVWASGQIWRAVLSTLPHANFFHLAFNLYWLWVFGTVLEGAFGHFKFALMVLLFAVGSALAEFDLLNGGVGLSGVGYGLWVMLWALDRHDPRFAGIVDRQTSLLFIGWFFLCIVLTLANVMPVANIAHGTGAGLGALLGMAISGSRAVQLQGRIGLAASLVLIVAGTVFWPWVNLSKAPAADLEHAGVECLEGGNNARGTRLLKIATHMRGAEARTWYNLGVGYHRLGRYHDAYTAYAHAAGMPDAISEFREAAREMQRYANRPDSAQ